jgi:hypothetical protein
MPDPQPVRLPVAFVRQLRARAIYLSPVPDHPGHVSWGCEDCSETDTAHTAAELGEQLAAHLSDCPG